MCTNIIFIVVSIKIIANDFERKYFIEQTIKIVQTVCMNKQIKKWKTRKKDEDWKNYGMFIF